jgi:hypothetical protein
MNRARGVQLPLARVQLRERGDADQGAFRVGGLRSSG